MCVQLDISDANLTGQLKTRPLVREENRKLFDQLFVEIDKRKKEAQTRFQSETCDAPDWMCIILEDSLDRILDAVRNMLPHVAASKHSTVLELEWRHSWDMLSMECCSKSVINFS